MWKLKILVGPGPFVIDRLCNGLGLGIPKGSALHLRSPLRVKSPKFSVRWDKEGGDQSNRTRQEERRKANRYLFDNVRRRPGGGGSRWTRERFGPFGRSVPRMREEKRAEGHGATLDPRQTQGCTLLPAAGSGVFGLRTRSSTLQRGSTGGGGGLGACLLLDSVEGSHCASRRN